MGRITETVKVLLIVNVIFYLGSQFVGASAATELFALWFFENPTFQFWQPLTHMFMHDMASPMHLIFNMYALWAFGGPIEQVLGQKKFIFFYFSAGFGAALIHSLVNYYDFQSAYQALIESGVSASDITKAIEDVARSGSYYPNPSVPAEVYERLFSSYLIPAVGASGAIYGVLVAFGVVFPNMELMLLFIPVPIKAKYFIPGLIIIDLFSGLTGFSVFGQNIANWAHIGGALFGFIMIWYWKKNSLNQNRWY